MMQLAGWDGPACIGEGVYRYSKIRGWSRLYIDVNGSEFKGGLTGSNENFEVALEEGE